ncbi:hypothetical protein ACFX2H_023134 [Malus domestica]
MIGFQLLLQGTQNGGTYSTFHNVNSMVGAGVLSLPFAMSNLGWYVQPVSLSRMLFAMPVFDMIETAVLVVTRNIYVAFTMVVGMTFPFFGGLMGLLGGFAYSPASHYGSPNSPCVIWLTIKKPRKFSLSRFINWICITLGVLLMILSPIGGLRNIILQAKDWHFYN